jgi:photosystem II stability/assembly factor-like uncharacterized protein
MPLAWLACALLCSALAFPVHAAFQDPLDLPARAMDNPDKRPVQAVAQAGKRLVAVGSRGLIIVSDDEGANWRQSPSPVQDDLVAVQFPTATEGWAVGHDGVILHTRDAGDSWQKQFDGRQAKEAFSRHYQARADGGDAASQAALELIERNYAVGPALPLLDVWFEDVNRGYAVGSFGTLLATQDGGKTWEPWLDRIDNEDVFNLNAIRGINGNLYIAAESGMIYRLNREASRFEKIATGYEGSFFGLAGFGDTLLAYGLMGTVYRSLDQGTTWTALDTPSQAIITAGIALPESGRFVLVNASGELLLGNGQSPKLTLEKTEKPSRYTGILPLAHGRFLITSLEGIRTESLPDASAQR